MLLDSPGGHVRLTYCTNVHPAETVAGIQRALDEVTVPVARRVAGAAPFGLGLWLPRSVVDELGDAARRAAFAEFLRERGLFAFTVNAFPYGGFHGRRVKESVFRPTWLERERLDYTLRAAEVLAGLLPEGERGSISTHSGQLKAWGDGPELRRAVARMLLQAAAGLEELERRTGRHVALALEPEPCSTLETTDEVLEFFAAHVPARARRHLGVCYDVCHQAVQFEDPTEALGRLRAAGVPVHKAQLSSAIELLRPGEHPPAVDELQGYDEPCYLHQVVARRGDDGRLRAPDLEGFFPPGGAWLEAEAWRVHFHVPVHEAALGPLGTTRGDLQRAIDALRAGAVTDHLEVETYTWGVLPRRGAALAEGLARELEWCRERWAS